MVIIYNCIILQIITLSMRKKESALRQMDWSG